jgi:hypothetical protein
MVIVLLMLVVGCGSGGQVADPTFDTSVVHPAYTTHQAAISDGTLELIIEGAVSARRPTSGCT